MQKQDKSLLEMFKDSESSTSVVFGAIVVIVVGILLFNYSRSTSLVTENAESTESGSVLTAKQLPETHKVVLNENLWQIAEKYYGNGERWTDIVKANNLTEDGAIDVGQELKLPAIQTVVTSPTPEIKTEVQTSSSGQKTYTVVKGEGLWDVAVKNYKDGNKWQSIYEANKKNIIDPDYVNPGQVLIIP